MNRLIVAQVSATASPGLLLPWARTRGIALDVVRPDLGEPLPRPGLAEAVVLLGADASANDTWLPWMKPVRAWTAEALAIDVPLLGLGLGAEIMAVLLGAEVSPAARPEARLVAVPGTDPAIAPGPWLDYGEDRIDFGGSQWPTVADARGTRAFRCGPHLGVTFHPQATPNTVAAWARDGRVAVSAALEDDLRADIAFIARNARALFSDWALGAGLDVPVDALTVGAVR